MGVAATQRGDRLISREAARRQRLEISRLFDDLDALPNRGPRPWGPIDFAAGNGGWWALDPVKGSGYWYKTLRQAVQAWDVVMTGATLSKEGVTYHAIPRAGGVQ